MTIVLLSVAAYVALAAAALWWSSRRASARTTELVAIAIIAVPLLTAIAFAVVVYLLFKDLR